MKIRHTLRPVPVHWSKALCEKTISRMEELSRRLTATDSVVQSVVEAFISRSEVGRAKYGTNLDRTDLKTLDWIQHAQEEFMDGILYLEKLKKTIQAEQKKKD